jgi:hypothetical protein
MLPCGDTPTALATAVRAFSAGTNMGDSLWVTRGSDEWREDVAALIAECHDLVALEVLVAAEAEVVAARLGHGGAAVAIYDACVEQTVLMQREHRAREDHLAVAVVVPAAELTVYAPVVDLGLTAQCVCDGQFLPGAAQVQGPQDAVAHRVQFHLWLRTAPAPPLRSGQTNSKAGGFWPIQPPEPEPSIGAVSGPIRLPAKPATSCSPIKGTHTA